MGATRATNKKLKFSKYVTPIFCCSKFKYFMFDACSFKSASFTNMSIYNVSIIFDYRDHRRRRCRTGARWTTTSDRRARQDLFLNHPPRSKVWTPRIQVSFFNISPPQQNWKRQIRLGCDLVCLSVLSAGHSNGRHFSFINPTQSVCCTLIILLPHRSVLT